MPVDLSHLEGDYAAAEIKARNFDPVPDGKYIVEVLAADVTEAKNGHAVLTWKLSVIGGKFDGRQLRRDNWLETATNVGWLKRDLATCEITLAKLNDINVRARELVGLCLDVVQKTNGRYTNIFLNRVLTRAEIDKLPAAREPGEEASAQSAPASDYQPPAPGDDDIPF